MILNGLGDVSYGVWSLVSNVLGYFVVLNSLQTAGTKYLAEYVAVHDYSNVRKLLGTSFVFNLGVGIMGGVIIFLLARPLVTDLFDIPKELQTQSVLAFQLSSIGFALSTLGWWGTAVLAGMQRFDWLTGVAVLNNTLYILGSLIAVLLGWGVIGVVAANLVGLTFSAAVYMAVTRRLLPNVNWWLAFDWMMFRRIFSYGFYSTTHIVFGLIAVQLDRTLLGVWVGAAAVATYSVPLSVANRIHQLCSKALEVVFPLASGLEAQQQSGQLKRLFLRAQNLNVVLVLVVSVPLLILANEILTYWIDKEFAEKATLVFQMLVIAYALLALNVVMSAIIAGLGHPEVNMGFAVVIGLGNLLGYVLFIPRWGVNGAGIASIFGSVISLPLYLWYVNRRFLAIPWLEIFTTSVFQPLVVGVLVGLGLFLSRPIIQSPLTLLVSLLFSTLAYLGLSLFLNVWQPAELALISQMWYKFRRSTKLNEV